MLDKISNIGKIGRRYFVVNSFDGVLTVLGVVMAAFISNISDPIIILSSGVGAAIALAISGFSSAYMTEKAERTKDVKELENKMLDEMNKDWKKYKVKKLPFKLSIVNSISPLITGLICISPFAFSQLELIEVSIAYLISISLSLLCLMFLGYFLGKISDKNKFLTSFKMLIVGFVTMLILLLLNLGGL